MTVAVYCFLRDIAPEHGMALSRKMIETKIKAETDSFDETCRSLLCFMIVSRQTLPLLDGELRRRGSIAVAGSGVGINTWSVPPPVSMKNQTNKAKIVQYW